MRAVCIAVASVMWVSGCATAPPPPPPPPPEADPSVVSLIEYEEKTRELMQATDQLNGLRDNLDDQKNRLMVICTDHPEHQVCAPQTAASYARKAFCEDAEFTGHIDEIVRSCHQGQCKQVDQAELLTRNQYMTLVQKLPHSLILFNLKRFELDKNDRAQLQRFLEVVNAEKGYIIVVGRASHDGSWTANLKLALDRAESVRAYMVNRMGMDKDRVGYITYGHEKMYLTELDAQRMSTRKLSIKQANRSALVFAYPCYDAEIDSPR